MCIGQDVHGNIKLSLKASLPRPGGLQTNDVVEGSATSAKETANIWAPVWDASSTQEQQNSASQFPIGINEEVEEAKPPTSQTPVILIRSAEECDEEEKSTNLNLSSKGPPIENGVQLGRKSKSPQKKKSRRSHTNDSPSHSGPLPYTNAKKPEFATKKESKSDIQRPEREESGAEKDLKVGTEVTAKVHQIRAHGLVLDLGGGLRGMYRFEVGFVFFVSYLTVFIRMRMLFLVFNLFASFSHDLLRRYSGVN